MDVDKALPRPHVYFEISIDTVIIGKLIVELFSDITPKTCENFLALCTGFSKSVQNIPDISQEFGSTYLQYKGTSINRAVLDKYIEGGSLVCNGHSGWSIYGQYFEDENFIMKHDKPGILSMLNDSYPNTNNSRFIITSTPLPDFDNKYVVFGQVVKGMGIVKQIQNIETSEDNTFIKKCVICDCGIYDPSSIENTSFILDGVRDWYADWPEDQNNLNLNDVQDILNIATHIKHFALRYLNSLAENPHSSRIEENGMIMNLITTCILNSAACKIKMQRYHEAIHDCDEALDLHPRNSKALFRRAQAYHGLHKYEESLRDLHMALELKPHDKAMMAELIAIKGEMQVYKIRPSQL